MYTRILYLVHHNMIEIVLVDYLLHLYSIIVNSVPLAAGRYLLSFSFSILETMKVLDLCCTLSLIASEENSEIPNYLYSQRPGTQK